MEKTEVKFFLSANTPQGFVCRFEQLINPNDNWRCFVLKGCPACGKSTLMKKVAEHFKSRCQNIEYIYCSSNPDSLDAVIFHDMKVSIVDGTPPHVSVFLTNKVLLSAENLFIRYLSYIPAFSIS